MSRTRAALTHFWPSILVVVIVAALIVFAWYPGPFLQFSESQKFSLALIGFGGVVGPILTWLVYKTHRFKFIFDMVVIVLIQVAAIGWASWALYQQRPYFMVFAVDRFEVVSSSEIDSSTITDPRFLDKPVSGAVLLYAAMPTDQQVYSELVREIVLEGRPDVHLRPELWTFYSEKQQDAVKLARPLELLRDQRPESASAIDQWVTDHGGDIDRYRFVPAMGKSAEFAVVLEADSGEFVGGIKIDPWVN